MIRPPPCSPLFPYTTLFRSLRPGVARGDTPVQSSRPGPDARRGDSGPAAIRLAERRTASRTAEREGRQKGPCAEFRDRKSTRLNSSHPSISYAVFCLKKKKK